MEYEIQKEFDKIIDKACKDNDLSLLEYLESVRDYGEQEFGCDSKTTRLYDKYRFDCEAWIEKIENGIEPGSKMEDFYEKWENIPNSKMNKWIVVAEMYEEYCHDILEKLLTLEKIKELDRVDYLKKI